MAFKTSCVSARTPTAIRVATILFYALFCELADRLDSMPQRRHDVSQHIANNRFVERTRSHQLYVPHGYGRTSVLSTAQGKPRIDRQQELSERLPDDFTHFARDLRIVSFANPQRKPPPKQTIVPEFMPLRECFVPTSEPVFPPWIL